MKCIKSTKTGEVLRVDDRQANNMVGLLSITWKYVPKSEWKTATRKTEKQEVEAEKKEKTISEKALKRKKLKEKQRQ